MRLIKDRLYQIVHSRKGKLTIRPLQSVELGANEFFDAEIVEGTVHYVSKENRMAQIDLAVGTPGDVIMIRASLIDSAVDVTPEEYDPSMDEKLDDPRHGQAADINRRIK
jgi:hypothetical protein